MQALLDFVEQLINGTQWLFNWLTTPINNITFRLIGMDGKPPIMILSVGILTTIFIYYTIRAIAV